MSLTKIITQLGIPFLGFIIFFIIQSKKMMSEVMLTIFVVLVAIITFIIFYHPNEWLLFLVGLLFGITIEIGMRYFGYQQAWTDASFFGVPYWLPLMWGFGFVIITRLGTHILKI